VSASSAGVDRARAECCVSGAQNEVPVCACLCFSVPVCACLCLSDKSVATAHIYSGFSNSTEEYFDIIGALCAGNGNGEYPGLLRTGYVLYSFVCTMRCYVKNV